MPKNIRESRLQPVGYLPGAQPTARQAWSGYSRDSGRTAVGRPGFSRWDTCRGRSLLPGKPGPAEAGTPGARRAHGGRAVAGGMPKNIRESRLQPVGYLPGAQPTARQAWSG
jgi:hypothetical protein